MPAMFQRLKKASLQTLKSLEVIAPMLLAIVGLVGIFETYITPEMIHTLFSGKVINDTLVGTAAGALSVGQPFLSYIISGELLQEGVSQYAVTAFILSFVTLGVIQLPLEFSIFGARFTLVRNILSFIFALLIAYLTTQTLQLLQGVFS